MLLRKVISVPNVRNTETHDEKCFNFKTGGTYSNH